MHIKDSARLSYHYVTEQDADFLWELDQDELVMKYINGGKKSSKEDIREIFVPRFQA
ncbi:MAG TPA: N-acetyltransferase, partial [Alteromonas macleodii]|nr:N-acetyltransferase [Alteromonas macleodii]